MDGKRMYEWAGWLVVHVPMHGILCVLGYLSWTPQMLICPSDTGDQCKTSIPPCDCLFAWEM